MSKVMRTIDVKSFVIGALLAVMVGLSMGAGGAVEGDNEEVLWGVITREVGDLFAIRGAKGFHPAFYIDGKVDPVRGAEPFAVADNKIYYKIKTSNVDIPAGGIPQTPERVLLGPTLYRYGPE